MCFHNAFNSSLSFQKPSEYLTAYNRRRGSHYSRFHGYAYDGIWVIAKAIDSILKQDDNSLIFDDLRSQKMHDALNDTDFIGVTVRTIITLQYKYPCWSSFSPIM